MKRESKTQSLPPEAVEVATEKPIQCSSPTRVYLSNPRVQPMSFLPNSITYSHVQAHVEDHHLARPKYRRDIDGLRAIAVLSVVAFHAFPGKITGGFVGVDVFFVISGFLISTIIFENVENDRFSYAEFYARRIMRIFPALILVMTASVTFGWFVLQAGEYKQLGKHVFAGAGFISNFALWGEAGYFDNDAGDKPLLHLWSLGIEEQFYILWPSLLGIVSRRKPNAIIVTALIAVASFSIEVYTIKADPTSAFYSPLSRFWELMIGGILAYATLHKPHSIPQTSSWRSPVGLVLIVASVVALDITHYRFPGWWALFPTIGAFLLISAGPSAWLNRHLLGSRLLVWIGVISYPLYLWHWPLLSFARIVQGHPPSWSLKIKILIISLLAAWITYRFVEMPIRRTVGSAKPLILLILCAVLFALGAIGYNIYLRGGYANRLGAAGIYAAYFDNMRPELQYFEKTGLLEKWRDDCNFYDVDKWRIGRANDVPKAKIDRSCFTKENKASKTVFIWGDSYAQTFYFGLKKTLPSDITILQVASSGCRAKIVKVISNAHDYCEKSNNFAVNVIEKEKPDVVLIAQLSGHDINDMRTITYALKKLGVGVVLIVGPLPRWKTALYKIIATKYWHNTPVRISQNLEDGPFEVNENIKSSIMPDDDFLYVDLLSLLCDSKGCLTRIGDDKRDGITTFDGGHLTPLASTFAAENVLTPVIMRALRK